MVTRLKLYLMNLIDSVREALLPAVTAHGSGRPQERFSANSSRLQGGCSRYSPRP